MQQPAWLEAAWREFGQAEVAGRAANPRIEALYRDAGHPLVSGDEVAWCAAFLGACLARSGYASTGSLLARSYLEWGESVMTPEWGAVAVLTRGSDANAGHVGFVVGADAGGIFLLGGNQGDRVSVDRFDRSRLIGLRRPIERVVGEHGGQSGGDDDRAVAPDPFDLVLAHVLLMEGGYTEDPYDPGGPTNKGITLAVYAAATGQEVAAETKARLVAELKAIPDALVRQIYRARYWEPSCAAKLPAAVGLMHFDASVNHGVGGASRMLQQACGVAVDGEIGPITVAAANSPNQRAILERYAQIRRERYRALPHFWRFGRGWLSRVDKTLTAAWSIGRVGVTSTTATQEQDSMSTTDDAGGSAIATKWWGQSMTIWGAVITALSTVLPVVAPVFGINITPELVKLIGEQMVQAGQAIGGLLGTFLTVYGRARASTLLERRDITLHL